VTDGFRAARGTVAGYLDVDLEVHARYVPSLVRAIAQGADIATVRRVYAFQLRALDRYFMSRGYSFLVRRMLDLPFHDTETGYKFFRRDRVLPSNEVEDAGGSEHRVHGASRPRSLVTEILGLRAPGGQDLDRPRRAGLVLYFRQLLRFRARRRGR
jgi:hypothetical protein